MFRFIGAAATASLLAGLVSAQTINAPEGIWAWQAELDMNGLKLNNKGTECISAENAELNLAEAVLGIDEACNIFGWNPDGNVTHFALACLGDQSIDMAGVLTIEGETAELNLNGDIRLVDASPLSATGVITATRTGICDMPDEMVAVPTEAVAATETLVESKTVELVVEVAESAPDTPAADVIEADAELAEPVEAELAGGAEVAPALAPAPAAQETAGEGVAEIMPASADGELLPLPEAVFVTEAPIVAPIPVEDAS